MKTPEDEAFDDLAKRQGDWGGGYQAKREAALDKLVQEQERLGLYDPTQPAQEPVAWWNGNSKFATPKAKDWDKRTGGITAFGCDIPLYTAPPQREWVGLTDAERQDIALEVPMDAVFITEAKLKERNHGT